MPHVTVEKTDNTICIEIDGVPVLSTGLDLHNGIVVDLAELIELLEEASDELVEFIENE